MQIIYVHNCIEDVNKWTYYVYLPLNKQEWVRKNRVNVQWERDQGVSMTKTERLSSVHHRTIPNPPVSPR